MELLHVLNSHSQLLFLVLVYIGTRCVEIAGLGAASLLNLYVVLILAKLFQPWDSVWISISVCKCVP